MENRNEKIVEFAEKWIAKFLDKNVKAYDLVDVEFADECFALSFEMDQGVSFCKKYGTQTAEDCLSVLDKVDDIDVLASAIFSNWRYFNHWAWDASEIDNHRDWFVKMLEKLKELALKV